MTVYCTTLTESLIESELFGHVKGAFTGAAQDKVGKLELAGGGTLFLDEIGDLSLQGQGKLLRFLQDRVFERVGGVREISVDVRIIAATHKDLLVAVREGRFREDLYYRLNVMDLHVPSLRERKEDLPALINTLYRQLLAASPNASAPEQLPTPLLDLLAHYSWPGNIRQLRNTLERLVLLANDKTLNFGDLPEAILHPKQETSNARERMDCDTTIKDLEYQHIKSVLARAESFEKAAEILGITTVTLWRKRKEYQL